MDNNQLFEDTFDNINNIAYGYNFKNGIEWADAARKAGEIDWHTYKAYQNAHDLRVRFSHGNARDISISDSTLNIAKQFERNILNSRVRGDRYNKRKDGGRTLPPGTFRFTKEFNWDGANGRKYYFRFLIIEEYQSRSYDDGTHFSGKGFTIYVKEAPYKEWCLAHNREYQFHYYHLPVDNPSICWNRLITSFEDANMIMFVWAKRYIKIIDRLLDKKTIDFNRVEKNRKNNVLPSGTFRKPNQSQKVIHIAESVYNEIMNTLGTKKPELGGMLGWKDDPQYIDFFVFDKDAAVGNSEYSPNTKYLSEILNGEWEERRIFLAGFVHSHPRDANMLSHADIEYAQRIMKAFEIDYLFMPIVTSSYGYKKTFNPYVVTSSGYVQRCQLVVEKNTDTGTDLVDFSDEDLNKIEKEFLKMSNINPIYEHKDLLSDDDTFARISQIIDIPYMNSCSIIGIGCGGAKSFYENMARVGVGNFYLFDGDISSLSNVASQNGYVSERNELKTHALKKRLLDINESVNVVTFDYMLNNTVDDAFLEENIISKINPARTVLCAFTDDFYAQARASRIAIKYKIPFVCAQHHEKGVTSELVFWYPGVTEFSLREIAKTRYEAYRKGYKNDVTSVDSPIFNTTRLNALCEKIVTGLLLYCNYPNHIYSSFVNDMSDKNLILIRQCRLDENHPFYDYFDNSINSYFDDVAWISPRSIEDLDDIALEENSLIQDTRNIF